jgi:hypothetical protein
LFERVKRGDKEIIRISAARRPWETTKLEEEMANENGGYDVTPEVSPETGGTLYADPDSAALIQMANIIVNGDGEAYAGLFGMVGISAYQMRRNVQSELAPVQSKIGESLTALAPNLTILDVAVEFSELRPGTRVGYVRVDYKRRNASDVVVKGAEDPRRVVFKITEGESNRANVEIFM